METAPKLTADNPLLGMGSALAAYFMLSTMMLFSKMLSESYSLIEVSFYRNVISAIPLLLYGLLPGNRAMFKIRQKPGLLVTRCVLGTGGMFLTFGAFAMLPLADATVLLFTSTLILPIMSYFFLKEQIHGYRWTAIAFGMIGVIIMAQPTGAVNFGGVGVALAAAFMHALLGTILRHLGKSESPLTVTFYFMSIGAAISAVGMPFVARMPTLETVPLIFGLGITGVLGQFFLTSAFKYIPASLVTIFNYTGIIWATLFGWMVWGDLPTLPIWIGSGIVIGSNVFVLLRERFLYNREQELERERQQEEKLS